MIAPGSIWSKETTTERVKRHSIRKNKTEIQTELRNNTGQNGMKSHLE